MSSRSANPRPSSEATNSVAVMTTRPIPVASRRPLKIDGRLPGQYHVAKEPQAGRAVGLAGLDDPPVEAAHPGHRVDLQDEEDRDRHGEHLRRLAETEDHQQQRQDRDLGQRVDRGERRRQRRADGARIAHDLTRPRFRRRRRAHSRPPGVPTVAPASAGSVPSADQAARAADHLGGRGEDPRVQQAGVGRTAARPPAAPRAARCRAARRAGAGGARCGSAPRSPVLHGGPGLRAQQLPDLRAQLAEARVGRRCAGAGGRPGTPP